MSRPVLILVNGVPGTGKTTMSRNLSKDLGLPCIGKDDIKELLFGVMGFGDTKMSQDQGAAASEMLTTLIQTLSKRQWSFIAESAFYTSIAAPKLRKIVADSNILCLEIYCKADPEVRNKRFIQRIKSGERHPGHADKYVTDVPETEVAERYAPMQIGEIIEYDTTVFSDEAYKALLRRVKDYMNNRGNKYV